MAPIQRPPKNTSKHDPLATVESDIEDNEDEDNEDEDDEDSSASSEASGGGNLRVSNPLLPLSETFLTMSGTLRVTSSVPLKVTSVSREISPSRKPLHPHPLLACT